MLVDEYLSDLGQDDTDESPLESIIDSSAEALSFEDWRKEMRNKSPSFAYWENALRLELPLLTFVGSIRTGDF